MKLLAELLNGLPQIACVLFDHAQEVAHRRVFFPRFRLSRWFFIAGYHSRTVLQRNKQNFELDQVRVVLRKGKAIFAGLLRLGCGGALDLCQDDLILRPRTSHSISFRQF